MSCFTRPITQQDMPHLLPELDSESRHYKKERFQIKQGVSSCFTRQIYIYYLYMRRLLGVMFILLGLILPSYAEEDFRAQLQENLEKLTASPQTALSLRFARMRFYPPRNTVYEDPSFWGNLFTSHTHAKEYSLAIYLFNMYVSTKIYNVKIPTQLTLNFLGVLDGISFRNIPFEAEDVLSFYQDHKQNIQRQIASFFAQSNIGKYPRSQSFEETCLRTLQKAPLYQKKPGYLKPAQSRLKAPILQNDKELLSAAWTLAKQNMAQKAVLFNVREAIPDNFDTKLANNTASYQHLYRWVQDECNYSSYWLGKYLTQISQNHKKDWGNLRIYMLTARPKTGTYLKPAQGNRFKLANGKQASKWQYHTVILAVSNATPHTYTPIVMDSFLGGDKLLTLDEWLAFFSANTVFFAQPFTRSKTVEKAIQEPQNRDSKGNIWVDGEKYTPAPIEQ